MSQVKYEFSDSILLTQVLSDFESANQVSFSYNSSLLSDKKLYIKKGSYALGDMLSLIAQQLNFNSEYIDAENIVLLPPKAGEQNFNSICGYIKDNILKEPMSFVNVYSPDKLWGTTTNELGYFELKIPVAQHVIIASFIGYNDIEIQMTESTDLCLNYFMQEDSEVLSTVILREYLDDGIAQAENTKSINLDPDKMNVLPGLIDNDIFASMLLLPGINSPSESLDDIYIRGGTPDQNLVLFDDIPVYHTTHLFGTISAFNPFIVDQVDVYRSAISSEFGGRVSGVIDIKSKSDIPDKMHFGLGLDMTHMHFDYETPLWKKSALFFSYRRSITDIWASPTFLNYADRVFQGSKVDPERFTASDLAYNDFFAFNDANIKWVYNLEKDVFEMSLFGALNKLNYSTGLPNIKAFVLDDLDLSNGGAKISWGHKWSDKLSSDFILTSSDYNYDYEIQLEFENPLIETPNRGYSKNTIRDGGSELSFNWLASDHQQVKFGYQFTENLITFELGRREMGVMEMETQDFTHRLHTLFGEYSLELPGIVNMDLGLRIQNSPVLEKRYFEPRISVVTRLNEHMRLKASTSKQFQFISQLVAFDINDLGFNNQIWVASDEKVIPVIESNQWAGGIIYEKGDWTVDVEGYVKELVGITSFSTLSDVSAQFAQGKSKVRGIDVLVRRRFKNFRSWVSYTLSESLYEFVAIPPGVFPAPHDQKNILQWVNIYKKNDWEFSLGLNLRSGLPYRDANGVQVNADGMYRIDYAELNASRLAPYFRADASIIYNFTIRNSSKGYIGLSFQNITGNTNIVGREFFLGERDVSGVPELLSSDEYGLSFTPNLGVHIKF